VHELFREVAQCVQQGGEQLLVVDQMVDDAHAGSASLRACPQVFLISENFLQKRVRAPRTFSKPANKTAATLA
jgi:hypothetical protein